MCLKRLVYNVKRLCCLAEDGTVSEFLLPNDVRLQLKWLTQSGKENTRY